MPGKQRTYTYRGEVEVDVADLGRTVKPGDKITTHVEINNPLFVDEKGNPAVAEGATYDANAQISETPAAPAPAGEPE